MSPLAAESDNLAFARYHVADVSSGEDAAAGTMDWVGATVRKIRALGSLPPGWDSYGASSIPVEARDRAIGLVVRVATLEGVPAPHVGATPDGEVVLWWREGIKGLEVFAGEHEPIEFVVTNEAHPERSREGNSTRVDQIVWHVHDFFCDSQRADA